MAEIVETPARRRAKPSLASLLAALAYAGAGAAFYLYSGRAEGLISPRLGFLLAALTSVPVVLYLAFAFALRLRRPRPASRWPIVAGIAACYLFIALGYRLDGVLTAETMARGDALAALLESHKRTGGAYPARLAEIAAGGGELPEPALADSAFAYRRTDGGGYVISFPSVAFLICSRTSAEPDWRCDD